MRARRRPLAHQIKEYQTKPFFLPTRTKYNHLHHPATNPYTNPGNPGTDPRPEGTRPPAQKARPGGGGPRAPGQPPTSPLRPRARGPPAGRRKRGALGGAPSGPRSVPKLAHSRRWLVSSRKLPPEPCNLLSSAGKKNFTEIGRASCRERV